MAQQDDLPQTSPDGRYALRIDEFHDRGSIEYSTYLVDRVAQRDIVRLADTIDGGFRPDGRLRVARPAWNGGDVLVDPVREAFRTRDDLPWLPLTAWGLGDSAYRRGWVDGIESRAGDPALAAPWVETGIATGALAVVALLAWKPWIDVVPRIALLAIAALVAVVFTWVAGNAWRAHAHMRPRTVEPRPPRG